MGARSVGGGLEVMDDGRVEERREEGRRVGGRVEETDGMKLSMQTNEARELTKS